MTSVFERFQVCDRILQLLIISPYYKLFIPLSGAIRLLVDPFWRKSSAG
jgi:hypothetical protein